MLLTSVLGHVQSHSRGGHVVCSSVSVGTVAHCDVAVSSGCLSVNVCGDKQKDGHEYIPTVT